MLTTPCLAPATKFAVRWLRSVVSWRCHIMYPLAPTKAQMRMMTAAFHVDRQRWQPHVSPGAGRLGFRFCVFGRFVGGFFRRSPLRRRRLLRRCRWRPRRSSPRRPRRRPRRRPGPLAASASAASASSGLRFAPEPGGTGAGARRGGQRFGFGGFRLGFRDQCRHVGLRSGRILRRFLRLSHRAYCPSPSSIGRLLASHAATIARARTANCWCPPVRHRSPCRMLSRPDLPASPDPTINVMRGKELDHAAHTVGNINGHGVAAVGQVSVCLPGRRLPVGLRNPLGRLGIPVLDHICTVESPKSNCDQDPGSCPTCNCRPACPRERSG